MQEREVHNKPLKANFITFVNVHACSILEKPRLNPRLPFYVSEKFNLTFV